QLVHHRVDGVLELENLAANVDGDFLGEVALRHRGRHLGDVADLTGQVAGHQVHAVGQVVPGAADDGHLRLTAQLAFRAHFARHARYSAFDRVQLVHHRVDGVLELENLAVDVDGDFLRQIAAGNGGGHFGDVADLAGQILGHQIHVVGEVL